MKNIQQLCIFLIFGMAVWSAGAQTCSINQTDTLLCAGTTANFTVTTSGGTPTGYAWDFGNGFTANTATPGHTYIVAGTYTPTVTVTFSGGATCTANGKTTQVFARPIAKFTITSGDTLCFKGNQLCIQDESTVGPSNSPIKKRIFQLSNGYIDIDNAPPFSSTICYNDNVDEAGHLFSLVLEVTDQNNCVDRQQKIDSVVLLPKLKPLSFTYDAPPTCYTTLATFTNTSLITPAEVKSFFWDFGDGATDPVNWATTTHIYSGNGAYLPRLIVQDNFGCWDTVNASNLIQTLVPDSTIYLDSLTTLNRCYKDNAFTFYSNNPTTMVYWEVFDINNIQVGGGSGNTFNKSFTTCGLYKLRMKLFYPNCFIQVDTPIQVYGPKTVIEDRGVATNRIINENQCEVHDTVFFKSPNPYLTCSSGNGAKNHLWDFGDAFAPPCTTDTRNGINIGMNCNYSMDSMQVYHVYKNGEDKCYLAKLVITDPLTGCSDRDSAYLALRPPDAGPDLAAVPPRRGLYILQPPKYCMGDLLTFMFDETLPECGYEKIWINLDSACGANNFILADTIMNGKYTYSYDTTCSEDGWITVGLIVKNGSDRFGNPCYDTAWYHHFLQLFPIHPDLNITVLPSCFPMTVIAQPIDSIQYNIARVRWNFNPAIANSTDTFTQVLGPLDSIIFSQQRTYYTKGEHLISVVYRDVLGCTRAEYGGFALGYKIQVDPARSVRCVNDSVIFTQNIHYYKYGAFDTLDNQFYWGDTARANAGKEKLWWDFGDGQGFTTSAPVTGHRYTKPGKYTVRVAARDSMGCLDTLVINDCVIIVQPQANISGLEDNYYCAPQIVAYKDSTVYLDSLGQKISTTDDQVVSWLWDFGDQTPTSTFQNPAHNYRRNGKFTALLTITTAAGCTDTATAIVNMNGPQPSFIIRDTLGCEPFTTTFINTTDTILKSWTLYFGDPGNSTFTTLNRDSVSFTYTTPGVYSVKLLGVQNIFNPNTGNTIICNAFFPDPLTELPERKVYVMGTPPMDVLVKDTVCPNEPITFIANGDSDYSGFKWSFGDGGTFNATRPDSTASHTYLSSGTYTMQLIPVHSMGYECIDTVRKNIVALPVDAKFVIDSSQSPNYTFINQSQVGVRYEWNFGKPDAGAANTSTSKDGAFRYQDTGTYIICLTSYNAENCWDSTCKELRIIEAHVIIPNVFTPDNDDNKNDAFDIDIAGYTQYELKIYNRWGAMVFEGNTDGIRNDGINWNGRNRNEGEECPAGTYYFIFTYQLITEAKPTTVQGTITLIRDK